MGTITAQILVGAAHPYHGGIQPTHSLYLSENDRPSWSLIRQNMLMGVDIADSEKILWIPTLERMLEDAVLLIAVHVVRDKRITALAKKYFKGDSLTRVSMYDDFQPDHRGELYSACQALAGFKVVVTAFSGSSLFKHLQALKGYGIEYEMCVPLLV